MLSARWVPQVYVYTALSAYFLAFAVTPGLVVWPSALGAVYPARPLYQIGMACAVLPHFALVLLWYVRTSSVEVLAAGLARFAVWITQTCITRNDDLRVHGLLSMVHDVCVALWMLVLYWKTRKTLTAKLRARLVAAYIINELFSLHVLSKYLVSGNKNGNGFYTVLKALAFGLELGYDYISSTDFRDTFLTVNWVQNYGA